MWLSSQRSWKQRQSAGLGLEVTESSTDPVVMHEDGKRSKEAAVPADNVGKTVKPSAKTRAIRLLAQPQVFERDTQALLQSESERL
jgi:hypothetical protein